MFDLTIVLPTVTGREESLRRTLDSYAATTPCMYEIVELSNLPTCGEGWVKGAARAAGRYIHFTADDLEAHPGWWQAAKETADLGVLPAPRILNPNGSLQSCGGNDQWNNPHENPTGFKVDFPRIPFMTAQQWEQIAPHVTGFLTDAHYWTDNAIGWAAALEGFSTAVHRGYLFTHHVAQEKRGAGMTEPDRMLHDRAAFEQLTHS